MGSGHPTRSTCGFGTSGGGAAGLPRPLPAHVYAGQIGSPGGSGAATRRGVPLPPKVPMEILFLIVLAALMIVAVSSALHRNPLKRCPSCKGRGVKRSAVVPWRYRPCHRCGRAGELGGER